MEECKIMQMKERKTYQNNIRSKYNARLVKRIYAFFQCANIFLPSSFKQIINALSKTSQMVRPFHEPKTFLYSSI